MHHSSTSLNANTGCYHDICRSDRCDCAISIGWLGLLGAAPFSIAYIVRACSEGVQGKVLSVFAGIFQFFFYSGCDFCDRTGGEG